MENAHPVRPWQGERVDLGRAAVRVPRRPRAGRAEALYDAERADDLGDRSRAEYAEVTLASRLMASVDHEWLLEVLGVGPVAGMLRRVGPDWCLVDGLRPRTGWSASPRS